MEARTHNDGDCDLILAPDFNDQNGPGHWTTGGKKKEHRYGISGTTLADDAQTNQLKSWL
jgi:hypothetical protein